MKSFKGLYSTLAYLSSWILIYCLALLMPATSSAQKSVDAASLTILYVLLSALVAIISHYVLEDKYSQLRMTNNSSIERPIDHRNLRLIIKFSSMLAIVGIFMLSYDRVFIQDIDYSQGIASAREQWRVIGGQRQGVSSIASVLGNLLSPFCFIPLVVAHLHWERLPAWNRCLGLVTGLAVLLSICLLNGGRSPLFLQISTTISTGLIRLVRQNSPFFPGRKKTRWFLPILLFTAATLYSIYVFAIRASTGGISSRDYALAFIDHLGGIETSLFYDIEKLIEPLRSFIYFATIALAYLVHSLWSFETLLDAQPTFTTGHLSFLFIRSLLSRLDLVAPNGAILAEIQGRFLPLPGVLWYDLGRVVWLASIIHGFSLGLSTFMMMRLRLGGGGFVFVLSVLSITLLSPFCFAVNLSSFPFMVFAYIALNGMICLFKRRCYWL